MAMLGARGRCRFLSRAGVADADPWCPRSFLFPGGTATAVDLPWTASRRPWTGPSGGGTCFSIALRPELNSATSADGSSHHVPSAGRTGSSGSQPRSRLESSPPRPAMGVRAADAAWRHRPFSDILRSTGALDCDRLRGPRSATEPVRESPLLSDPSSSLAGESSKLLVSLATYNEAGNLRPLVEAIRRF